MNKNFNLIITVFVIWISLYTSAQIELFVSGIFVLSLGLMHGANDINLLQDLLSGGQTKKAVLISIYVLLGVVVFTLAFYWPVLGLILFMLFSGYHFGEQHWEHLLSKMNNNLKNIFFFCYGLLILYLVFFFNQSGVIDIIYEITGIELLTIYCNEIITSVFLILSTIILYIFLFSYDPVKLRLRIFDRPILGYYILIFAPISIFFIAKKSFNLKNYYIYIFVLLSSFIIILSPLLIGEKNTFLKFIILSFCCSLYFILKYKGDRN